MIVRTDLPPIAIRGRRPPPLLGALGGVLRFFADPVAGMQALHREHGDVAAVVDRNAALVCAFGAAHNRAVCTRPDTFAHLSEVPIPVPPGTAFARFQRTVIFMNGEDHRARRRLLMPAFSRAAVDGYAPAVVEVTDAVAAGWPTGETVAIAPLARELTVAVVLRCLFGLAAQGDGAELGRLETGLLATIAAPLCMLLPRDLPGLPYRRALRLSEQIEARLRLLVAERRASPGGTDALSRLVAARDERGAPLPDDDLLGECNTLFAAGYDTSANTLAWTLILLALHPAALTAVADELDEVLGGEPPRVEHLARLPRLDRVVKESMRLLPTAVLLFMRVCAADTELGGHALPRGAQVLLSPLVTHREPGRYPEPDRFDPDRWATLAVDPYEYLPFGAGARMCIGAAFAGVALRLTLARLLQRAWPELPRDARVDYEVRGPSMGPTTRARLRLVPPRTSITRPTVRGTLHRLVDLA